MQIGMGKNVDGDKKRKIYMADTLSPSNARGVNVVFLC